MTCFEFRLVVPAEMLICLRCQTLWPWGLLRVHNKHDVYKNPWCILYDLQVIQLSFTTVHVDANLRNLFLTSHSQSGSFKEFPLICLFDSSLRDCFVQKCFVRLSWHFNCRTQCRWQVNLIQGCCEQCLCIVWDICNTSWCQILYYVIIIFPTIVWFYSQVFLLLLLLIMKWNVFFLSPQLYPFEYRQFFLADINILMICQPRD